MVEVIQNDPFIPYAWQRHHSGMQGSEYKIGDYEIKLAESKWLEARDNAVNSATLLHASDCVTKQLCNRLLEPFMWCTVLATGNKSSWNHFFGLRCPEYTSDKGEVFKSKKDFIKAKNNPKEGFHYPCSDIGWQKINKGQAELHMMILAECIYDAINESTPEKLNSDEWHIPYKGQMEIPALIDLAQKNLTKYNRELSVDVHDIQKEVYILMVKVASGLAARTSYTNVGGSSKWDYEQLLRVHDKCKESGHNVVFEHCARVMNEEEYETHYKGFLSKGLEYYHPQEEDMGWCRNYKGFLSYRSILEDEI